MYSGTLLGQLLLFWSVLCLLSIVLVGFASRVPTWRLPAGGRAADLVTEGSEEVGTVRVEPVHPADMHCAEHAITTMQPPATSPQYLYRHHHRQA